MGRPTCAHAHKLRRQPPQPPLPTALTDLMEVAYRADKAWTCRFLASEDR